MAKKRTRRAARNRDVKPRKWKIAAQYKVTFSDNCTHWCGVVILENRAEYIRVLKHIGHAEPKRSAALTRLIYTIQTDGMHQVIILHKDDLRVENVFHECIHVCFGRALFEGYPRDHDLYEEGIATAAARMACRITQQMGLDGFKLDGRIGGTGMIEKFKLSEWDINDYRRVPVREKYNASEAELNEREKIAGQAVGYILRRIKDSPELGFYLCEFTESWQQLADAYSALTGQTKEAVVKNFAPDKARDPASLAAIQEKILGMGYKDGKAFCNKLLRLLEENRQGQATLC